MTPLRRRQLTAIFTMLAMLIMIIVMTNRCAGGMSALITAMDAPRDASSPGESAAVDN